MLTFYNERGESFGAQVEFTVKNAVNGERSVSGTIISNDRVLFEIDRGWKFELNGEFYSIVYAKPRDEGHNLSVSFDAVHQFFYDFEHSNCYTEFNGSHRFEVYIEAIFKNSGYRYQIEPSVRVNSIRKENFGNAKRLEMLKDIVKAAGLEFSVSGKVVLITKKIGADLSTVVRKNFNMNELVIEKNINKFITYKRGLGAWKDEEDQSKGRYTSEYESPLARIYGRIEGEPVTDERYKDTGKLLERLKFEVDNSYSISVQLDMEDLTRAGYQYTQPRAGDYIMAINETIGFREKIRIVSFESSYDVTGRLINHKVTCNDIGSVQKQISSEGSIIRSVGQSKEYAENALAVATRALVSADGKNTVYYGATKPKDEPIGTIKRGDILYLTAGEDTEMYIWNGSEWELKKLKSDTSELEKEFDKFKKATEQASEENKRRTDEALKKAGTLPDASELSDQIKQQILSSPDLQNKVTEGVKSVDGDTIYSKIVSKVSQQFASKVEVSELDRVQSDQGRNLLNLSKQIAAQTIEYNKLTESNKIYERILGKTESDAPDKLSRLIMSSEIFQTEVGKYVTDDNNLIVNSMTMNKHTLIGNSNPKADISVNNGIFTIKAQGLTGYNWSGFSLPIYVKKIYKDETYTLGFKYRIREYPDSSFAFNVKNHGLNKTLLWSNIGEDRPPLNEWQEFQKTFTVQEDFAFGEDANYPFYIYLAKNGWIEFKEPILVRGSRTGTYKPSQFDDAYKKSNEAKDLAENAQNKAENAQNKAENAQNKAENAQAKAIEVAEKAEEAKKTSEATRAQMTLLSNSWSVKTLNSASDVLGAINLNPDGSVKINEGLISIGEKTYIKDGVIKKSMIGNAQIGTAHIGEIDASQARIINISSKNIVTDGLTANVIRGGNLSSLNGATNFDLQSGWLKLNGEGVGIFNQFDSRPIQYLVFHKGAIHNKLGSYTALMSNSHGWVNMDDGSAGIQIWNTNDNTTAVNLYGDEIAMMYNATDQRAIVFDNVNNEIKNVETMKVGTIGASHEIWIKGKSLAKVFDLINQNFIGIENWFKRNKLGSPGRYDVRI
nr:MAG TPA: tail protein [Caudoviricetes sp.]